MSRKKEPELKPRPDGRYRCKYKDKYFYGSSSKEAYAARNEYIKQEATNKLLSQDLTVKAYARKWLPLYKSGVSDKCYNDYAHQLEALYPYIGSKLLSQVTVDDAAAVWAHYAGYSASTIKRARMLYVALFDTAIENELCRKNPFKSKYNKPPRGTSGSHRALTPEEISLVSSVDHRFRLAAMVMLYAGLRRGEVLALSMDGVDLKHQVIHVVRAVRFDGNRPKLVDPKTEAGARDVPIPSVLLPYLRGRSGLVAPSADGVLMSETAFKRAWDSWIHAVSLAAGHPVRIRTHDFRHTYCTMLRDAGVDLKQAMIWLGHADEKMILKIYDHAGDYRASASMQQLEKHLKKSSRRPRLRVVS